MALGRNNIEYRDNSEEVIRALGEATARGLFAIGLAAEGHAKRAITDLEAVDTGRLRNSITFALSGEEAHIKEYRAYRRAEGEKKRKIYRYEGQAPGVRGDGVYLGTNVEYAPYVELGTSKMRPRAFLRPAATEHAEEYKQLMRESLENA